VVTFLGLPRELRNKILTFVLLHQDEAPTDVSDASGRAELDDIDSLGSKRDYVLSYVIKKLCCGSELSLRPFLKHIVTDSSSIV
jgi:hypothetical protein